MRVLIISAAFPPMPSGESTNAYHLCQHLADRGLDVHVLTSDGNTAVSDPRITIHPIMRSWSWAEVPRLLSFLRRCAPDVAYLMYIGWTYQHQFMITFLPTLAKRVLPGLPFVTRFENVSGGYPYFNSMMSRVIRKGVAGFDRRGNIDYEFGTLLRDSDTIVVLSARHQAVLESTLPGVGHKCVLIPPPVNMKMSKSDEVTRQRGRAALKVAANDFLLAYIGFVYPGKGLESLLRAVKQVRLERPNVRLVVIGGPLTGVTANRAGYLEGLQTLARELQIHEDVIWTGEYRFDDDDASMFLRAADACVLPFDHGVQLNNSSFSSAAAHGLPIITTMNGSMEPQFVHGSNTFLCQPQSAESLALAISAVSDDGVLRDRLSNGSLRLSKEWFSWKSAVDTTLEILRRTHLQDGCTAGRGQESQEPVETSAGVGG